MLRTLWAWALLVPLTAALALPAFLITLVHRGSDSTALAGRWWSRIMLAAVGARVRYVGLDRSRAHRPCVFIANHQSNVDIWVLMRVLPLEARFVAKQSLFRMPFLGWAMAASGFVPIDRSNRTRAVQSLELAASRVRAGRPVVLFAEGSRSRDGQLQPFKKGPFHLALRAGVPVVPIAISGSFNVMRPGGLRVRPGPVDVQFLEAIDVAPFLPTSHAALRERVHEVIAAALGEPRVRAAAP